MIAIVSMAIHHTAMVLWQIVPAFVLVPMYFFRGITFPIMAFFVVEGFRRTSNIKNYMARLLLFGLVAQVPYTLAFGLTTLNIIFTILLGLVLLALYDKFYVNGSGKPWRRTLFVVLFIVLVLVTSTILEGGLIGPVIIFLLHVIKDERKRRIYPLVLWGIAIALSVRALRWSAPVDGMAEMFDMQGIMQYELHMTQYPVIPLGTFMIIPLLLAYNGERGRHAKLLFYVFYPLHLAVLAAISFALGLNNFI